MTVLTGSLAIDAEAALEAGSTLSDTDLAFFSSAIERRAGIALKASKPDLVRTRLRARLAAAGCKSFHEYRQLLEGLSSDHDEWQQFVNLLTTNKTDFFREPGHFDFLARTVLPAWLQTNATVFRVWSAAASTGEEAYTLAMVLDRHLPKERSYQIHGSDIDTSVLAVARNGVYQTERRVEIPTDYHMRCLDAGRGAVKQWFRIKPALRQHVTFGPHNLIEDGSPGADRFDLILCRNVLIYFAPKNVEAVCGKLHGMTKPGGYLFIGHSEAFHGFAHPWESVGPSIYRRRAP